jgi:hypothetical protein
MRMLESREIYNRLKQSAKKRNIPFNLTLVDINELSFPITCPIMGIPLTYNRGQSEDNSYSIDRIDSSRGYEPDNIIVISNKANRMKNDGTIEELKLLADFYSNL